MRTSCGICKGVVGGDGEVGSLGAGAGTKPTKLVELGSGLVGGGTRFCGDVVLSLTHLSVFGGN